VSRSIEIPEYEVYVEVRVDPTRTALVVVDMQNDFVRQGGNLLVPDAEATIPAINRLLQADTRDSPRTSSFLRTRPRAKSR